MEFNMYRFQIILIGFLISFSVGAMAGEKGYLGLSFSVDGEGFFWNPTLNTIKIEKVVSNSPAAKAGIESGDLLLEIEGKKIAGAKLNDMKPYLERELGQTVRLAIQKSSGEVKQLAVVAGPKIE
jgi:C-terminal processing protease CtpA/Prc